MKFSAVFVVLPFILFPACHPPAPQQEEKNQGSAFYGIDSPYFQYTGRFLRQDTSSMRFAWSGSRIDFRFTGPSVNVLLTPSPGAESALEDIAVDYYHLILDGEEFTKRLTKDTPINFTDLQDSTHSLTIFKRTEALVAEGIFEGVILAPGQKLLPPLPRPTRKIEFIGNSITCGYGNEGSSKECSFSPDTENAWMTYSHLTALNLGAQYVSVCYSGKGIYQNYDKTKNQLMPELWRKYSPIIEEEWHFGWTPDIVAINLGTNDFAHEIPPKTEFVVAYQHLIQDIMKQYPKAKVVCLTGSMMRGRNLEILKSYLAEVVSAFPEEKMYRFDLSPQGDLGMGCDWHPNIAQHTKNAQELSEFLSKYLYD